MNEAGPPEVGRARDSNEIERWVLLVNPKSTNALRVNKAVEKLHKNRHIRLHSEIDRGDGMQYALQRALGQLDENSGLMIAGGDGTVHHAVNALMTDLDDTIRHTPVLALGAGYGNDIALSLTTRDYLDNLSKLLKDASIRPIHPIQSQVTTYDTEKIRYAVAYMGVGGTARGAQRFDSDDFRRQAMRKSLLTRWLTDGVGVIKTIMENEAYEIRNARGNMRISEFSVANFPREAKFGRWPLSANERGLYASHVEGQSIWRSTAWLGRLALGRMPESGHVPYDNTLSFRILSPRLPIHWDAETGVLQAGDEIRISSSDQPFYAVSTNR